MKRLFCCLLAMMLMWDLTLTVSAQSELPQALDPPTQAPTEAPAPTQPVTETPQVTTPQPTEAPSEAPTETPDHPPVETTAPSVGSETCAHSWLYVEVPSTCTEYGARGYVCIHCEAVSEGVAIALAPHTYDDSCDPGCNVCGAERSVSHKFSGIWSKNSTQHWHACSVCGEKSDIGAHYPGPVATEERAQYCLTCGLMMMPQKAHTHVYSSTYTSDEAEHWYGCTGCDERDCPAPHSYDNPCDPDCNVCGRVDEKTHEEGEWLFDGQGHWTVCNLCGIPVSAEDHVPGEITDTGFQECSVCGFALSAATDHVHEDSGPWENDEISHWKRCSCGEKTEEDFHHWDFSKEIEDETMLHTCTVCGAEKTDYLPEADSGLPWWIPAIIAALLCGALALTVVMILGKKNGIF